jgi:hypothetical protein
VPFEEELPLSLDDAADVDAADVAAADVAAAAVAEAEDAVDAVVVEVTLELVVATEEAVVALGFGYVEVTPMTVRV